MSSAEQTRDNEPWKMPVTIVSSSTSIDITTNGLITLYIRLARMATEDPNQAPGLTIVDCSALVSEKTNDPALYALWITRISTPGLFSHSCAGAHLRRQFAANAKVLMTFFNDDGGHMVNHYGHQTEPGTYMIVLKRIDIEKMQCVPVSFTAVERKAIREYVVDQSE